MRASEQWQTAGWILRWLSDKRKYPVQQYREFWEIGRRYAELTKRDPMIRRSVVSAVKTNGFRDRRTQASA
jgi:hypothetical protein